MRILQFALEAYTIYIYKELNLLPRFHFPMNRTQILSDYRQRIHQGDRIKLTTDERAFLVQDFIEQLQGMDSPQTIRQLCQDEIALLEAGYGAATNSTTNYLSKYRSAIAQAVESGKLSLTENTTHHFVGRRQATGEEFEAINHLAWSLMRYDNSVYVANRKATNVGNNARQDNPQPFVPDRFLEKASELLKSEEAETLAVGIAAVTGRRHTEVAVSGQFERTKHPYLLTFNGQLKKDEPVAYTIVTLLPAIEVLTAIDRFRAMPQVQELQGLSSEDQLVKNFRARVNTRVKRHFQETEILPILPGFQSVSVHRLRGAYARMIIYYWLPNQGANEQRFLQFYLGHVEAAEMRDASNSNSTTHYFGYRLVDADGKPITASGIKLMGNPPLPSPTPQQIDDQLHANERLETIALNDSLSPDLEDEPMPPSPLSVETIAHQLEDLPAKQPSPQQEQQNIKQQPKRPATPAKPKYKDLAVNLNDLTAAANRLGLHLPKGRGYQALLQQVLGAIAADSSNHSQVSPVEADALPQALAPLLQQMAALQQQIQDLQAGRESLGLLEREVAMLRDQLQQVQQERDSFQAQAEQVVSLQQECDQLKTQLQAANDRLHKFLRLAQEETVMEADSASSAVSTTQTPLEAAPHPSVPITAPQPVIQDAIDQANRQQGDQKPKVSSKMSPEERIAIAIEALMHHNLHCADPKDRWFISGNTIASATGTNPATKVKPWLDSHPDVARAIDQHNQAMETTQPHHNRGKEKEQLRSIYHSFAENRRS